MDEYSLYICVFLVEQLIIICDVLFIHAVMYGR